MDSPRNPADERPKVATVLANLHDACSKEQLEQLRLGAEQLGVPKAVAEKAETVSDLQTCLNNHANLSIRGVGLVLVYGLLEVIGVHVDALKDLETYVSFEKLNEVKGMTEFGFAKLVIGLCNSIAPTELRKFANLALPYVKKKHNVENFPTIEKLLRMLIEDTTVLSAKCVNTLCLVLSEMGKKATRVDIVDEYKVMIGALGQDTEKGDRFSQRPVEESQAEQTRAEAPEGGNGARVSQESQENGQQAEATNNTGSAELVLRGKGVQRQEIQGAALLRTTGELDQQDPNMPGNEGDMKPLIAPTRSTPDPEDVTETDGPGSPHKEVKSPGTPPPDGGKQSIPPKQSGTSDPEIDGSGDSLGQVKSPRTSTAPPGSTKQGRPPGETTPLLTLPQGDVKHMSVQHHPTQPHWDKCKRIWEECKKYKKCIACAVGWPLLLALTAIAMVVTGNILSTNLTDMILQNTYNTTRFLYENETIFLGTVDSKFITNAIIMEKTKEGDRIHQSYVYLIPQSGIKERPELLNFAQITTYQDTPTLTGGLIHDVYMYRGTIDYTIYTAFVTAVTGEAWLYIFSSTRAYEEYEDGSPPNAVHKKRLNVGTANVSEPTRIQFNATEPGYYYIAVSLPANVYYSYVASINRVYFDRFDYSPLCTEVYGKDHTCQIDLTTREPGVYFVLAWTKPNSDIGSTTTHLQLSTSGVAVSALTEQVHCKVLWGSGTALIIVLVLAVLAWLLWQCRPLLRNHAGRGYKTLEDKV